MTEVYDLKRINKICKEAGLKLYRKDFNDKKSANDFTQNKKKFVLISNVYLNLFNSMYNEFKYFITTDDNLFLIRNLNEITEDNIKYKFECPICYTNTPTLIYDCERCMKHICLNCVMKLAETKCKNFCGALLLCENLQCPLCKYDKFITPVKLYSVLDDMKRSIENLKKS